VREELGEDGAVHVAVGAVASAVELFVTDRFENDAASLPARSCTAEFDVAEFDAGATYDTVTVADPSRVTGRVRFTFEPDTATAEGVMLTADAVTVNALAGAVVAWIASSKVKRTVWPFARSVAALRTGAVTSLASRFPDEFSFDTKTSTLPTDVRLAVPAPGSKSAVPEK